MEANQNDQLGNERDDLFLEWVEARKAYRQVGLQMFKAGVLELFSAHPALDSFEWAQTSDYNDNWYELDVRLESINGGQAFHHHLRYNEPGRDTLPGDLRFVPKGSTTSFYVGSKDQKHWENFPGKHRELLLAVHAVWAFFKTNHLSYGRRFFRVIFGATSVNYVTREGIRQEGYVPHEDGVETYLAESGLK